MKQRGSRSALAYQRQVSLVGDGAKWQITNLRQVAAAMAKWAWPVGNRFTFQQFSKF
jgi:hypothetical protein